MAPSELMEYVAEVMERFEIPYLISGSVATITYGEHRSTADVDIVAKIELRHVGPMARAFPDDRFYLSEEAMTEAIRNHGQFNIIDSLSGYKADIIIPGNAPLDRLRFERAVQLRIRGSERLFQFSSPEDVILKKLESYHEGESDKHLRDIAGVLRIMGDDIDRAYITKWAARLDVLDIWQLIQQREEQA